MDVEQLFDIGQWIALLGLLISPPLISLVKNVGRNWSDGAKGALGSFHQERAMGRSGQSVCEQVFPQSVLLATSSGCEVSQRGKREKGDLLS